MKSWNTSEQSFINNALLFHLGLMTNLSNAFTTNISKSRIRVRDSAFISPNYNVWRQRQCTSGYWNNIKHLVIIWKGRSVVEDHNGLVVSPTFTWHTHARTHTHTNKHAYSPSLTHSPQGTHTHTHTHNYTNTKNHMARSVVVFSFVVVVHYLSHTM